MDITICQNCKFLMNINKMTSTMSNMAEEKGNIQEINNEKIFVNIFIDRLNDILEEGNNNIKMKSDVINNVNLDINLKLKFDKNVLIKYMKEIKLEDEIREIILYKYEYFMETSNKMSYYLKCELCKNDYVLQPSILYTIDINNDINQEKIIIDNIDDLIEDNTLLRTKDFICPNKECDKKITNENINKEAIIYRIKDNSFETVYICVNCKTIF